MPASYQIRAGRTARDCRYTEKIRAGADGAGEKREVSRMGRDGLMSAWWRGGIEVGSPLSAIPMVEEQIRGCKGDDRGWHGTHPKNKGSVSNLTP